MSGGLDGVTPRWEWRAFGPGLDAAAARLAALAPTLVRDSDEIYVLARGREASIKSRDGVMDVKRLEHVNADGLEQWLPVVKSDYPLRAEGIRDAIAALGTTIPPLQRGQYTFAQLLDEVVGPSPELMAIEVHKHRSHYLVDGCMTELSEVRTGHGTARTIAVESEDPDRVVATVRALDLELRPNVSLPRELKTLAGFDAHRYAVIDVGTNSVKFHVGERRADGTWRKLEDRAEVTRLGEGLDASGRLQDEPVRRTVVVIADMESEAARAGVEAIVAVGTAGLRMAPNRDALVDAVRARTGVEVAVISGEEESRLAYVAAVAALGPSAGTSVVFDTGGGSSQFTFGHGEVVDERFSVDVGAIRVTERFGLRRSSPTAMWRWSACCPWACSPASSSASRCRSAGWCMSRPRRRCRCSVASGAPPRSASSTSIPRTRPFAGSSCCGSMAGCSSRRPMRCTSGCAA
ncbi:MAG: Ppx/GppA family phosphatase [Solirubrobacteraceae bacterium]